MNTRKPWSLLTIIIALSLLLPAFAWAAYPAEVFRTGETKCYNSDGIRIPCNGTGQDGEIQAGVPWPNPRFVDNGDGTVTDKLTGLEWLQDAGTMTTWSEAFGYVKALTTGGHSDWRLPNANELQSLIDDGRFDPALPKGNPFKNVRFFGCDSSLTSCDYATCDLWVMHMGNGVVFIDSGAMDKVFVWPVRSGQCGASDTAPLSTTTATIELMPPVYDATVTASADTVGDGAVRWQHALEYVAKLNSESYLGYSDWRLPNKNELRSLVDYSRSSPALPPNHPFTNLQSWYWSSTSRKGYPYCAFNVSMYYGNISNDYKWPGHYHFVWPVRSGQLGAVDTAVIGIPKTGQTKCYNAAGENIPCDGTGQDGELQAGVAWPDPRFKDQGNGMVIDNLTGLVWTKDANLMATRDPGFDAVDDSCAATNALGADNPKLENLRLFRDRTLAKSALGRKFIQFYYSHSDSIIAVLDLSTAVRSVARSVLEAVAPMLEKK